MTYTCHECKGEHSPDNVSAFCANCFSGQKQRILKLILERDTYKDRAELKWGMRQEFEKILGLEPSESYQEESFKKAIGRLKKAFEVIEFYAAEANDGSGKMAREFLKG